MKRLPILPLALTAGVLLFLVSQRKKATPDILSDNPNAGSADSVGPGISSDSFNAPVEAPAISISPVAQALLDAARVKATSTVPSWLK